MQRDGYMKKIRKCLLAWMLALSLAVSMFAVTTDSSAFASGTTGTSAEETETSSGTETASETQDVSEAVDVSEAADTFAVSSGSSVVTASSPGSGSYILGDVNGDGSVTTEDLYLLWEALSGAEVTIDEAAADVNGDGSVTMEDLYLLSEDLSGVDTGYDIGQEVVPGSGSYILGDVNSDGSVTTEDLYLLWEALSGAEVTIDEAAADVNGDGSVTMEDLYLLWEELSGVDTGYDIGQEVGSGSGIETLTMSDSELNLAAGETAQLSVDITPQEMEDAEVTWSSSDEEIAAVSADGLVTASSENTGRAVITA